LDYYKTAEAFDWYKHYPAAFTTQTAHLSHVELGVYRRLLDHYWTSDNSLPRDVEQIAERVGEKVFSWRRYGIAAPAGFDNEEVTVKIVEHLLNEFFEQDEDGNWRHIWLDDYRKATDTQFKERSKASKERSARQARGAKGRFGKVERSGLPCLTAETPVPHGDGTVEQSRTKQSTLDESTLDESKLDENKVDQSTAVPDGVATLPKESPNSPEEEPPTPEELSILEARNRLYKIQGKPELTVAEWRKQLPKAA
jgi:uncharacterized protein YdaU (DUF1376 family)